MVRTPGHAFKMGVGQIKGKLADASPEEKAALLNMMQEIEEDLGFRREVFEGGLREVIPDEPVQSFEEALEEAVPEPSPNGRYHDLSHVRERLERRLHNVERALDRGQNAFENAIHADAIREAIQFTYEAEKIPGITRTYGCPSSRSEMVTLDGYQDEHPVVFRDWTYTTSDPMEIFFIERRIRGRKAANETPTRDNEYLRSSAEILEIGNRVAMVNWDYTAMFAGFKTPEDADMEERLQQQIRVSKRMQRLRR